MPTVPSSPGRPARSVVVLFFFTQPLYIITIFFYAYMNVFFFPFFSTHYDNIYCLANISTTLVLRFVFVFVFTVFCFWLNNFTVKNNTVLPKQNKHRNYKKNNITLLREYIKKNLYVYLHTHIFFFLLCKTATFKMYARLRWLGSTCVHIFASFSPVSKRARQGGLFSLLCLFIAFVFHDITRYSILPT